MCNCLISEHLNWFTDSDGDSDYDYAANVEENMYDNNINEDAEQRMPYSVSEHEHEEERIADSDESEIIQYQAYTEKSHNPPAFGVMISTKKGDGSRVWDKKHCCKFCLKLFAKLPRHLEQKHKDELEVVSLQKKSAQRKTMLRGIMNEGDFLYNKQVVNDKKGILIPYKRPKETDPHTASDYLPCKHCLAFFLRHDLWRHVKRCPKNVNPSVEKHVRHQIAGASLLTNDFSKNESFKKNILSSMSNDDVSFTARHDELIVRLGERIFSKCLQQPHQYQYVKQKMREISRLLIGARKSNPDLNSLMDCIDPQMFPSIVKAVKNICGFNEAAGQYKIPSLALKLGHSLKKCATIVKTKALINGKTNLKEKAVEFIELCCNEWSTEISSMALQNLHAEKFNKPNGLPLADDLKKLNVFLESRACELIKLLTGHPNEANWRELAKITLAQLVLFNRRRGNGTFGGFAVCQRNSAANNNAAGSR